MCFNIPLTNVIKDYPRRTLMGARGHIKVSAATGIDQVTLFAVSVTAVQTVVGEVSKSAGIIVTSAMGRLQPVCLRDGDAIWISLQKREGERERERDRRGEGGRDRGIEQGIEGREREAGSEWEEKWRKTWSGIGILNGGWLLELKGPPSWLQNCHRDLLSMHYPFLFQLF